MFAGRSATRSSMTARRRCVSGKAGSVRVLLTSGGITNTSIHDTLVGLLGKPIAESTALFVPTAIYPFPGGPVLAWEAICGAAASPLAGLGWK